MSILDKVKNQVVIAILKKLVSKYFDDLKVAGYNLSVVADDKFYKIEAQLPKESINNLIKKIQK